MHAMITHKACIRLTGFLWFAIGSWLFYKGLKLVSQGAFSEEGISSLFGNRGRGAAFLVSGGLLAGYLKGRFVLHKTVGRVALRILSQPLPLSLKNIYAPSYWILIGSMMMLGMLLNILPVPPDLRGAIDIAIGSALINGAILYFRFKSYL